MVPKDQDRPNAEKVLLLQYVMNADYSESFAGLKHLIRANYLLQTNETETEKTPLECLELLKFDQ